MTWVDRGKTMPRGYKIMLSFPNWPAEDQGRWEAAFKIADRFDESSYGAHLAPATRKAGGKAMGESWASSRLYTRIALRLRLKHGSIGALSPTMLAGAQDSDVARFRS